MQIYALDFAANLIFADNANKHQDYQCVECQQTIRLRRGIHRKAHYYHLQPNRACRQYGKGMPHLMLQHFLKNILPEGEVELECQFRSIGRIADVAWHAKHLIYEIQCSPISAEEVKARNASYASIGYQVIWIFHDERYNQHRLSAAEDILSDQPHYFSDMNKEGEGQIYDQFAIIANGRRVQRLPILPIDLSTPKILSRDKNDLRKRLPSALYRRAKIWPLVFSGDTIDSCLNLTRESDNDANNQAELALQLRYLLLQDSQGGLFASLTNTKNVFRHWIARPYQSMIKLILEKACR
jgi:competence protein CoiA